jgi:nicotinate-nucleotide--dimethylbenzimidazole phosphoribosyltransferase
MRPEWLDAPIATPDRESESAARVRQQQLTKPPGSLGRLEELAIRLAALQQRAQPGVERVRIAVFAADHGVVAEGISAFPQAVTVEMVRNFAWGGAAISVLARELGATLEVVNVGTVADTGTLPGVVSRRVAAGTANLARAPAMTTEHLTAALNAGREAISRAVVDRTELFIGGEMGIGNTTAAAAVACALLGAAPEDVAGPGTGLAPAGIHHKAQVIRQALTLHQSALRSPEEVLRHVGGLEIAALTGAFIAASRQRLPVLVDGFIASVAALAAVRIRPEVRPWLLFAHRSAEPGHARILAALEAQPLVDLGMRLGEGSGAAVALPLLRLACALHNRMATFSEAGVSNQA